MYPLSLSSSGETPGNAFHVPVGAASPLWLLFAGSAMAGVAYWWMTRWPTLYANLEAELAEAAPALPAAAPEPVVPEPAAPEPMVTVTTLVEAAVEAPPEAPAEAAAEVVEAAGPEPVEAAPKPRPAKKAPPSDDLPLAH